MPPRTRRALLMTLLGGLACACVLLIGSRMFGALFAATGHWQKPAFAHVQVIRLEKDPFDPIAGKVHVLRGGQTTTLRLLKGEMADLAPGAQVWVMDTLFASPRHPAQFRVTPLRLATEFPEPLLLLSLWGFFRLLRSRWGLAEDQERDVPDRPRRVLTDDFHTRADQRRQP